MAARIPAGMTWPWWERGSSGSRWRASSCAAVRDASLIVIDKQDTVGYHQTSHNSGWIYAGVFYTPGSLKARLCAEGRPADV